MWFRVGRFGRPEPPAGGLTLKVAANGSDNNPTDEFHVLAEAGWLVGVESHYRVRTHYRCNGFESAKLEQVQRDTSALVRRSAF